MHDTALRTGELFFKNYGFPSCSILDVGSMDVNGTLRQFAPNPSEYIGVDLSPGPGVDIILKEPGDLPFEHGRFDLTVSTSCFEHDPTFWMTFLSMCCVTKSGGFVYISAPSNGPVHRHPVDCWRFYPDAAVALVKWVNNENIMRDHMELIENFRMSPSRDGWIDQVMIFGKLPIRSCSKIRDSL